VFQKEKTTLLRSLVTLRRESCCGPVRVMSDLKRERCNASALPSSVIALRFIGLAAERERCNGFESAAGEAQ
jgi:hypothetical protein